MPGRLFAAVQRLLPQHALTRWMGRLAASEAVWIKDAFIRVFSALYGVDLAEADRPDRADYRSFNDFFTRALKPGVRPFPEDDRAIACPADGAVSQSGRIEAGTLLQAKGVRYSLASLAGELGDGFDGGSFVTVYLAPHNYHRVHTPCAGELTAAQAVPGALYSVNVSNRSLRAGPVLPERAPRMPSDHASRRPAGRAGRRTDRRQHRHTLGRAGLSLSCSGNTAAEPGLFHRRRTRAIPVGIDSNPVHPCRDCPPQYTSCRHIRQSRRVDRGLDVKSPADRLGRMAPVGCEFLFNAQLVLNRNSHPTGRH